MCIAKIIYDNLYKKTFTFMQRTPTSNISSLCIAHKGNQHSVWRIIRETDSYSIWKGEAVQTLLFKLTNI